jgi:hypothetical protein
MLLGQIVLFLMIMTNRIHSVFMCSASENLCVCVFFFFQGVITCCSPEETARGQAFIPDIPVTVVGMAGEPCDSK